MTLEDLGYQPPPKGFCMTCSYSDPIITLRGWKLVCMLAGDDVRVDEKGTCGSYEEQEW